MIERLKQQIKHHEGFSGVPYQDTTGHTTIGYGLNLSANPLTPSEAEWLLDRRLMVLQSELETEFPVVRDIDDVRQAALLNMAYNLGLRGLGTFKRMWDAIGSRNWEKAAREALDSRWAEIVRHVEQGGLPHVVNVPHHRELSLQF